MIDKRVIVFICLIVGNVLYSQNTIRGIIRDDNKVSIPFASVQLIDSKTQQVAGYSISQKNGEYSISFKEFGEYSIEVNHINFNKYTEGIELTQKISERTVILINKLEKEIEGIVIQSTNRTARVKGDTISYNLRALTTGDEEKLKDILNKLPGIDVQEGRIRVNGKQVDKLLIDGKEFFGNNQRVATDNLNAEMINSVDVLTNYQSHKIVKEIESGNQTALNIRIKKEYKGKFVGDVSLFSAYKERYKIHTNLFRFGTDFTLGVIADVNNTGEQAITMDDYINLKSSIKNDINNNTISTLHEIEGLPTFLMGDNNVTKRDNQFGAVNFSYTPSPKIKIDGYSFFNNTHQKEKMVLEQFFLNTNYDFKTLDSSKAKGDFLFNQTRLNIEFTPNKDNSINYSANLEPNKDNQQRYITSKVNVQEDFFNERNKNNKLNFGHQLSYISKLSKHKLVTLNIYQEINQDNNKYTIETVNQLFDYPVNELSQYKKKKNNEIGILGKYSQKIENHLFAINTGYIWKTNKFENHIKEIQSLENISFQTNYSFIKSSILKNKNLFQYFLEVEMRKYKLYLVNTESPTYFLPQARIKLAFKQTHSTSLYYKRDISYPLASTLNKKDVIVDYRNRYLPSLSLENKELLQDIIGVEYFFLDLFSGTTIIFNSNYTKTKNHVTTNSNLQNEQINNMQYINSDKQKKWDNFLGFETKINFIKSKVRFNIAYSMEDKYNYMNYIEIPMRINTAFAEIGFRSYNKKSVINYDIGNELSYTHIKYENLGSSINNTFIKPFVNLFFKISDDLKGNIKNGYEISRSGNIKREIYNLGFKLSYKEKKSSWKFWIEGNDILNVSSPEITEVSVDNNILQRTIYYRIPGYAGAGVSYNL